MPSRKAIWTVTAVTTCIAIGVGAWLWIEGEPTGPTALSLNDANLAVLSPAWPKDVVHLADSGDAGPAYRTAIAEYQKDSEPYSTFAADPQGTPPKAFQLLLDNTSIPAADLFASQAGRIVNYEADHPPLTALENLGNAAIRAGMVLRTQNRPDEGNRYFRAVYALGFKLYQERICYDEYRTGLALVDSALVAMNDNQDEKALADYDQQHVQPIYSVLSSIDPNVIAQNAGDVVRFATLGQDRMIRVEAILKLGRYRFDADRSADQAEAELVLQELAKESDPAIQAAARAALGLTIEQYRQIH